MPKIPRLSVVIPTYNSAKYLASTVDSILGQTMPDLELVLYDDGSTDDTLRIGQSYAERDARVRVVRGAHGGIAVARNAGLAATHPRSELVTFFDHDDIWEANAAEWLSDALERNPDCAAAHGVARCIDADGRLIPGDDHAEGMRHRTCVEGGRVVPLPVTSPTTFGAELVRNYITTPGTSVVRRSVMAQVGGFEPSAVPCDDWDMNLRICRRGDFAFVDRIVLNWRRHPGATSNSSKRWRTAYVIARQRTIDSPDNTLAQRQAARYALRAEVLSLGHEVRTEMQRGMYRVAAKKLARSLLLGSVYLGARLPPGGGAPRHVRPSVVRG